jgi:signal transduction histidine kinase
MAGQGHFAVMVRRPDPVSVVRSNLLASQPEHGTMDLLARALDSLSAEVALLDASGRIIAVNRAWRDFARLNGFQSDDAGVGTNYLAICDGAEGPAQPEASAIATGLRSVLGGRQSATYVEYPCDSPEEQRWFQVRASGFDWGGRRYAVVSHESLTESKRAEQRHRQQLDEMALEWQKSSLGELASGIAHELNQPLGAITNYMNGCLRRLEAGTIDREQLIKTARECAELAEFAGGIIKRMRGLASQNKCQYQPVSFNDAVSKAMQFYKASPESGRVQLAVDLAPGLPQVRADEVQIQQVALNLLRNASDAVRECGCTPARVRVSTRLDGEGLVCLAVTDNGRGLPDGVEDRLFEPFFSTKSKGMGLGLSISKTIAEVHGGRLSARNAPGGGAVFEFRLPPLTRAARLEHGCAARRSESIAPDTTRFKSQGGFP